MDVQTMSREQRLAWTLVLESMIGGDRPVVAKAIAIMAERSGGSVDWYMWPTILGDVALESLLAAQPRPDPAGDQRLAQRAFAEFGGMLESTAGQFLELIGRARGQDDEMTGARHGVDRELWRTLAICALLARETARTAIDVLRDAETRLAAES